MTILDKIIRKKREEVAEGKYRTTGQDDDLARFSFYEALSRPNRDLAVIAEVKKASPSKGVLVEDFNHIEIAKEYERLEVDCISVLTDEVFFQGHANFLTDIKRAVKKPVLRKDFIIDEQQILHSKEIGADAILLIAAALEKNQIGEYMDLADSLKLDVLMEVHDEEELEMVLSVTTPKMIGVNNRDLQTFKVSLETSERLAPLIPESSLFISESGIKKREDVDFLRKLNVDGMLVGEAFMIEENKEAVLRNWF